MAQLLLSCSYFHFHYHWTCLWQLRRSPFLDPSYILSVSLLFCQQPCGPDRETPTLANVDFVEIGCIRCGNID